MKEIITVQLNKDQYESLKVIQEKTLQVILKFCDHGGYISMGDYYVVVANRKFCIVHSLTGKLLDMVYSPEEVIKTLSEYGVEFSDEDEFKVQKFSWLLHYKG